MVAKLNFLLVSLSFLRTSFQLERTTFLNKQGRIQRNLPYHGFCQVEIQLAIIHNSAKQKNYSLEIHQMSSVCTFSPNEKRSSFLKELRELIGVPLLSPPQEPITIPLIF